MNARRRIGDSPRRLLAVLAVFMILAAGILTVIHFGQEKQGFHEDEVYSYFSSNRTAGLAWPDHVWLDTQTMTDECVVLPGEGFRYQLVHTVQSWDVHPPLYYDLLHTVCSLVPGVFSKWTGIGLNLAAYVLCFFLLLALCRQLRLPRRISLLILLVWAIHPMTVSAAMFIRMYLWLTVFVLLCLLLHLRLLTGYTRRRMILIMLTSCFGFLTHYYYFLYFFFTGVTMALLWFFQKTEDMRATNLGTRLSRIGRYVLWCAVSLLAAVLIYPSALSHILRGYRGKEAAESFFSPAGWASRISFFTGLVNDYLFSGVLAALLFLFLILAVTGGRGERTLKPRVFLLILPAFFYFLVVSETALLLGNTSNRYLMPVYPIILLVMIAAGFKLLGRMIAYWKPEENRRRSLLYWKCARTALYLLLAGLFLFVDLRGLLASDHVLFLYPENRARIERIRENNDIPAVIIYNEETPENIWRLYDKLAEFSEVYFIAATSEGGIEDEILENAGRVYVFAADTPDNIDRDARIADLFRIDPSLRNKQILDRMEMWTWFELGG